MKERLQTTTQISSDNHLNFMLRILLYDLKHVGKNPFSEERLNRTTDEHYLSMPYFTPEEAVCIKDAIVDTPAYSSKPTENGSVEPKTVHDTLTDWLQNFFDKRRASGDSRPCGRHDLLPLYSKLFGIDVDELRNDTFIARMRRQEL